MSAHAMIVWLKCQTAHTRTLIKPGALGIVVALTGLAYYMNLLTHYPNDFFWLDSGWFLGLQEQLQQGRLLGRDTYFTYGPLAQVVASSGVFLRSDPSPLVGYATNMFMLQCASLLLLAGTLMLLREVRPLTGIFVCIACVALSGIIYLRSQMLLFSTVTLASVLVPSQQTRRLGAAIAGALWFAGQMVSTDVGIYSLATAVLFLGMMAALALRPFRGWFDGGSLLRPRDYIETLFIGLVSFMACHLMIEVYFQMTQPSYGLFDHIRYNLAIAMSYSRTMTFPWAFDSDQTIVLFLVLCYNLFATIVMVRSRSFLGDSIHLIALFIAGSVQFRGAITRSDAGHILQSSSIHVFLFLLLLSYTLQILLSSASVGYDRFRLTAHRLLAIGLILLVLLPVTRGAYEPLISNLADLATRPASLRVKMDQVWNTSADVEGLAPADMRNALSEHTQIVNFPYANDVAMALGKPVFAPVLQTYAAHNEQLQRLYVERLHAMRSQVEVIYAVDGSRFAGAIDGVQQVSRVPIIATYLIEHFHLKHDHSFSDGLYILEPRKSPVALVRTDVPFTIMRNSDIITVSADATQCTFVEINLTIDYPITAMAGRPRALIATASHNGAMTLTSRLVPIELGRPFATLIYLGQPHAFSRVFADERHPDVVGTFDTITLALESASLFTVNPSQAAVNNVQCVNLPQASSLSERQPYTLKPGETLNLWEHTWVPAMDFTAMRRTDDGLFIHSGHSLRMGPYLAPSGMCLTTTASFDAEVAGKPDADGAEFVASIAPLTGAAPFSRTVALAPDEMAVLQLALPDNTPFYVHFETRPRGNNAWDWAVWRTPRIEPCARSS